MGPPLHSVTSPRWISPKHPRAAGSYGPTAIEWIRQRRHQDDLVPDDEKEPLEAWRYILDRALEHDDAGRLVWPVVVLTVPRQSTKSSLMSELMAWRIHQAELFGERQIAVHTANKLQAAIRIQEDLHAWARSKRYKVSQRTGQERITLPDHSRWEITSLRAAYGSRPSFVFVDEAFDVPRELVEKALLPAQARRKQPQVWLVSTANTECTDLMLEYMARAKAGSERVCLLDWGIPDDADPLDRSTWPASNPYPAGGYLELVEANVGTSDWVAQWLNRWPRLAVETGWIDPAAWQATAWPDAWPAGPVAITVETSPRHEWAVARATRHGEIVLVEARAVPNPAAVRDLVGLWRNDATTLRAGANVLWALPDEWNATPLVHGKDYAEASGVFVDLVRAGNLRHVPAQDLDAQLPAMHHKTVGHAAQGILRGTHDFVARCAVWAAWTAHQRHATFLVV